MFDAKKLTDDQVSEISQWATEGAQLADIQKRMEDEMKIRLTYMDTRFLVLDLGIELRNLAEEAKSAEAAEAAKVDENGADAGADAGTTELAGDDLEALAPESGGGSVSVTVDEIARPGVMASGRVTFPNGQAGVWYVDERGQLGLDPDTEGYRPTEADVMAFQRELQAVMDTQ